MNTESEYKEYLIDKYPKLPHKFNIQDKYKFIDIEDDGLKIIYTGFGRDDSEIASIRTENPIPISCGIFYFEINVVSSGDTNYIGIGVSAKSVSLNRMPGWDYYSLGYHGDDGKIFESNGRGEIYGPTYSTGDIIGCCLNCISRVLFYTKNGISLPTAFQQVETKQKLYPIVGLRSRGEIITANFGKSPFKFDIESYFLDHQEKIRNSVFYDSHFISLALNHLIFSHLINRGFANTLLAFSNECDVLGHQTLQKFDIQKMINLIQNRKNISNLILDGKVDQAIDKIQNIYSGLLEKNQDLLLVLKTQDFVESINSNSSNIECLLSKGSNLAKLKEKIISEYKLPSFKKDKTIQIQIRNINPNSNINRNQNIRNQNIQNIRNIQNQNQNQIQNINHQSNNLNISRSSLPYLASLNLHNQNIEILPKEIPNSEKLKILNQKNEKKLQSQNDQNKIINKEIWDNYIHSSKIEQVLGLIAFSQPKKSHLNHLFNQEERLKVSKIINKFLLNYENQPQTSLLEKSLKHFVYTKYSCAKNNIDLGSFAMFNIKEMVKK
ncbi:ran-binding protein [Anaeramoeba ignava]|uniref:Ran-binding protein n=1 Tax=Anaeramoeba ignava TaxID=1746090 RepID=A0A9Q0LE54_ANAIG|nr:ran-binding protein [Anaeramoeba ignava]